MKRFDGEKDVGKLYMEINEIKGMKLHPIAEKIASLVAAILLLLSHSKYVQKRTPIERVTGVVSAIKP